MERINTYAVLLGLYAAIFALEIFDDFFKIFLKIVIVLLSFGLLLQAILVFSEITSVRLKKIIIKLESRIFYFMVLLGIYYLSVSSVFFILRFLSFDVVNLGEYLAVLFSLFGFYIVKLIKPKKSKFEEKLS